ncbi:Folylpolyglutamate synthase [Planctomycetes bacterium MalM25]|nr:Folylpolyglutamate synthase [Planctomycetes bacterium MalM25]
MSPPTYDAARDDAIAWLMGRINYERTRPVPYAEQAFKLDAVRELLRRLDDPQEGLKIVHLAGTKGKGSTGAMIAAALQAAGHTTGVYSSPHLDRLEERFAVGGEPCPAAELVGLVERVRPHAEAMDHELGAGPTFFDLTTAMALAHFADRGVDAVVLEVGLGGRLDSTNIVTPALTAITSISLDHTKQLGPTRAAIAAEKAGILKAGVPCVSGVADSEAGDVIARIASERGCPLMVRERDFHIEPTNHSTASPQNQTASPRRPSWVFTQTQPDGSTETIEDILPALPGGAQAQNAAVALAALGTLANAGWDLPIEARRHGIAAGRLPARLERFEGVPPVVVDGAHNDASARALAEALDGLLPGTPRERRVLVVAISDDKDLAAILEPLAQRFGHVLATRYLDNPRAADPGEIAAVAARITDSVSIEPAPAEAFRKAKELATGAGAVVFAGSLLFAAEARRLVLAERP